MRSLGGLKPALLSILVALGATCIGHAAEPRVVELWPEGIPDLKAEAGPEKEENGRFTNIHRPTLTIYEPSPETRAGVAVIYAPGGGYIRVAAGVGGGEVTRWLNSIGATVFMLKYRNVEYGHPAPLRDALRAVRVVRSRAAEFRVKPGAIGMLGGSAGGHLTAAAGTLFDHPVGRTGAELDRVSGRPDFMILVFAMISMREVPTTRAHPLLGAAPTEELKRLLSVEEQVTKDTPPTFLVHSAEDRTVPVENSILFYQAMRRANAPIEMHLYPRGPHGSGMSPALGPISEWPRLCETWMRFNGWLPKQAGPQ